MRSHFAFHLARLLAAQPRHCSMGPAELCATMIAEPRDQAGGELYQPHRANSARSLKGSDSRFDGESHASEHGEQRSADKAVYYVVGSRADR